MGWSGDAGAERILSSLGDAGGKGRIAAPGLLWGRIRAELRQHLDGERGRHQPRRRWLEVGLAAAVLLFGLWLGLPRGTTTGPEIVIVELDQPPLLDFSPVGFLREGGGR